MCVTNVCDAKTLMFLVTWALWHSEVPQTPLSFPSLDCLFKQLGAAQKGILWMQFVTSIYNDIT